MLLGNTIVTVPSLVMFPLFKVVLPGFSTVKLLSPPAINKYLCGVTLKQGNYSVSLQTSNLFLDVGMYYVLLFGGLISHTIKKIP